jgi:hypothetical protein
MGDASNIFNRMTEAELEELGTMVSVGRREDIDVPKIIFIGIRKGRLELQHNLTKKDAYSLVNMILDAIEGKGLYES